MPLPPSPPFCCDCGPRFWEEAAQDAISDQFSALMGKQAADLLQSVIAGASAKFSGVVATIVGIVMLIATASGVFGEMKAAPMNRLTLALPVSGGIFPWSYGPSGPLSLLG